MWQVTTAWRTDSIWKKREGIREFVTGYLIQYAISLNERHWNNTKHGYIGSLYQKGFYHHGDVHLLFFPMKSLRYLIRAGTQFFILTLYRNDWFFVSVKDLKVSCYEIYDGMRVLIDNSQQVKFGSASYCTVWANLKENWDFKRSLKSFLNTSYNFIYNISKCKVFSWIENECNILSIHFDST